MAVTEHPERVSVPITELRTDEATRSNAAASRVLEPGDLADVEEGSARQVRAEQRANSLGSVAASIVRRWFVGVVVLALVMGGDVAYTMTRVPTYLAQATFVVSPSASTPQSDLVYGIDTLGRGAIVGTMVSVLGSAVVQRDVLQQMGYSPDLLNHEFTFTVSNVATTAVILENVESPDPQLSANLANLAGQVAISRLTGLYPVYDLTVLSPAIAPTSVYKPDKVRNYGLGVVLGLVLGIAAAYGADLLLRSLATRRRRGARSA